MGPLPTDTQLEDIARFIARATLEVERSLREPAQLLAYMTPQAWQRWQQTRLPGAVLTRVAASHLRVGTFQVFASRGDKIRLRALTDYAIARHYPQASGEMGLLSAVRDAQAELIAGWMAVGFIHGVMNTDNSAISGETIDYGPCAFLDAYHPDTVFSSIDHQGRYAYSNQPNIAVWNLAQLATYPLVLREPGSKTREALENAARRAGVPIEAAFEVEGREAIREIVASGAGVGVVSEAEFGHDPRLVKIDITGGPIRLDEALVCLKERAGGRLVGAFMELATRRAGPK